MEEVNKNEENKISSVLESQMGENKTSAATPPDASENNHMKLVFGGIAFVLIIFVIVGAYFVVNSQKLASEETTPQSVVQEEPTITAKVAEAQGISWKVVNGRRIEILEEDALSVGDEVQTESGARLVVNLSDGSVVRIDEDTSLVLTSLETNSVNLVLDSGAVFSLVSKNEAREYTVSSGDTDVTALGTAFSVENYGEVKVGVYENKVKVKKADETVEVGENFEYNSDTTEKVALKAQNIGENNFLQWSLEQEIQKINNEKVQEIVNSLGEDATKEDFQKAADELNIDKKELIKDTFLGTTEGDIASISLSGEKTPEGAVSLNWTADGLAENGYKVVWSQTPGKDYPGDKRSYNPLFGYAKTLGPMKSGTWYYRVCEWIGETCGIYSNEITISF